MVPWGGGGGGGGSEYVAVVVVEGDVHHREGEIRTSESFFPSYSNQIRV